MASFVHGWRWYNIVRCARTEELTLRGTYGMHVHTNPSPHAACRGANYAMWMTPEAKERVQGGEKHDPLDAPLFDCSCGFYSYRLFQGVAKDHQINAGIIAHVTAIEKVILHEEGFRAQMYHLDYLLEPVKAEQEITVFNADAGVYNPYGIAIETVTLRPAMVKIAESLNVPILEKDDLAGCPDCLIANSWRSEKEITAKMRKDWYGG